jgi:hypothetical protein
LLIPELILLAKVLLEPWNPEMNWFLFPDDFILSYLYALTPALVGLDELLDEGFGETSAVCKLVGDLFVCPFMGDWSPSESTSRASLTAIELPDDRVTKTPFWVMKSRKKTRISVVQYAQNRSDQFWNTSQHRSSHSSLPHVFR